MNSINLSQIDRTTLSLVGSFVEVRWASGNRLARRQCEKCVYVVRGFESGMVCVELVYDAIEGIHAHDAIYWVPVTAVQYLKRLTDTEAERRVQRLEREALGDHPRD